MPSPQFNDAFRRLAAAENRFLTQEFLAPVVAGGEVHVRIAGVVNRLRVSPRPFTGFGVFRPTSPSEATLVRPATLTERTQYLNLFPLVRLILARREGQQWFALPAHRGDRRIQIAGLAPVLLVEEAELFDIVCARFDGANFWFAGLENSRDPATAAYLRRQLAAAAPPNQLDRSGLTLEERLAYALHFAAGEKQPHAAGGAHETPAEAQLRDALAHAGAELVEYLERGDGYRVTFAVEGQQHTSAVNKHDLTVQVAGICLSGEDQKFDLASLVGVLREAGDGVLRIGDDGIPEANYWNIHPPR